jgi:hypothetical protein
MAQGTSKEALWVPFTKAKALHKNGHRIASKTVASERDKAEPCPYYNRSLMIPYCFTKLVQGFYCRPEAPRQKAERQNHSAGKLAE